MSKVKINIYEPIAQSDGQGGETINWRFRGFIWAEILQDVRLISKSVDTRNTHELTLKLRNSLKIKEGWRAHLSGESYLFTTFERRNWISNEQIAQLERCHES